MVYLFLLFVNYYLKIIRSYRFRPEMSAGGVRHRLEKCLVTICPYKRGGTLLNTGKARFQVRFELIGDKFGDHQVSLRA